MTIDEEKQQLRATIRRLSAQLPFRYREAPVICSAMG